MDLTQQKFAERIGTTANVLTNYETGRRNPSSSVINNICKTFNVSEEWLRTGKGEMYRPETSSALDALARERNLTHGEYIVIEKFLKLRPDVRSSLISYFMEVAAALDSEFGVSPDDSAYPFTDVSTAEALYESSLGFASNTKLSALTTTDESESREKKMG